MSRTISLETARAVVADSRSSETYRQECQAIIAASGSVVAPAPMTPPAPPAAPVFDAPAESALLGIDAAGAQMTTEACRALSKDPVEYLTAAGVQLTATGKSVLDTLRQLPRYRAKALGIDIAAVDSYARAHGIDPDKSIEAAITTEEQRLRDAQIVGSPLTPRW